MHVESCPIEDLKIITPTLHRDSRGFFFESYQQEKYQQHGITPSFVQDNHSLSQKGTLRGLHFQSTPGQAKLLRVVRGKIFDVAVDIRPQSKTFGHHQAVILDSEKHQQFYIPTGFAHGFLVLSDEVEVLYKVSTPYNVKTEQSIAWNDGDLAIAWPISNPLLSQRDQHAMSFAHYKQTLPR